MDALAAGRVAVRIRRRELVHVSGSLEAARTGVLVGRELDERLGRAVVGPAEHEHVARPGVGARQAQRQVVGLAPRAHEVAHVERTGEGGSQPAGVLDDVVVQVARVGVELRHLARACGDHVGVTMSDVAHVVHAVEVAPSARVEQVGAAALDDLERLVVGKAQGAAQVASTQVEDLRAVSASSSRASGRTPEALARPHGRTAVEVLDQSPGRLLADRQIGIVRIRGAARSRHRDAEAQPRPDQIEQDVQLQLGQREHLAVAAQQGLGHLEGVHPSEHGVGQGDGRLAHDGRAHQVSEVDQPRDARAVRDQDVVVVGVAMDQPRPQAVADRTQRASEVRQGALDQRAPLGIVEEVELGGDPSRPCGVPGQIRQSRPAPESLQVLVEAAEEPPEGVGQVGCQRYFDQPLPREPTDQAHSMAVRGGDPLPRARREQARNAAAPRLLEVQQDFVLRHEPDEVFFGVGDLQDPPFAVGACDREVLILIARQGLHLALESVQITGQVRSLRAGEGRLHGPSLTRRRRCAARRPPGSPAPIARLVRAGPRLA